MPSGKGVTISVTAETDAGRRRHMEDYLDVQLSPNEALRSIPDLREQAFVGVFDGHGGKEAALYARERFWDLVQEQRNFRTTDRQLVMKAIREAYLTLHSEMEPLRPTWKRNKLGDLSTAGTTACTVVFRQDHFYVANVGDSSAVIAIQSPSSSTIAAKMLTKDHKPEDPEETRQIESLGGQVKISRKGVPRVVWERRRRSNTPSEEDTVDLIPFLSVSRSLGDFWSWSEQTQKFVVSPDPDISVHPLDPTTQRFIVVASDGLWNVMTPQEVVEFVWRHQQREEEEEILHETRDVVRALIDEALDRWQSRMMFADNIAIIIAFLKEENSSPAGVSGFASSTQPVGAALDYPNTSSNTMATSSAETVRERDVRRPEGEVKRSDTEQVIPALNSPVIHHVSSTHTGSTVYHKESSENGSSIEYHTKISLRCRRKDKYKLMVQQQGQSHVISEAEEGGEESGRSRASQGKRRRQEDTHPLPCKKSHWEGDSGCESDGERGATKEEDMDTEETREARAPLPSAVAFEEPSSDVFSGDSSPDDLSSPDSMSEPAPLISADHSAVVVQV